MNRLLFRKAYKDLFANKGQTFALAFIIAVGIISYITLVAAFSNLDLSYQAFYEDTGFADATFAIRHAPESLADEVKTVSGVEVVNGRLVVDTGFTFPDGSLIRSRLIGYPDEGQPGVNDLVILEGRYFNPGEKSVALVESRFAEIHEVQIGDKVTPLIDGEREPLEVVGIVTSPEYLIVNARSLAILFVPIPDVQTFFEAEGEINEIAILVDETADRDSVVANVEDKIGTDLHKFTILQENQPSNAALQADLDAGKVLASVVPVIIMAIAAVSIYVMLGRTVMAQQPQIGLMKALGYHRRAVLLHYLTFALLLGVIGTIIGLIVGSASARFVTQLYAGEVGLPYIETQFHPEAFWQSILISLVFTALAGIGPAYAATRRTPADAMRYDPSTANISGSQTIFERWHEFSLWTRLTLRNVFKVKKRLISNVLGVTFAFVLVLMSWSFVDSMAAMIDLGFNQTIRWDAVVNFNHAQPEPVMRLISRMDDVIDVEPVVVLPATLSANGHSADVTLTAFDPNQSMHALQLPAGNIPQEVLGENQIVLSPLTAESLQLEPGDTLRVENFLGERILTYSQPSDELITDVAYISIAEFEDVFVELESELPSFDPNLPTIEVPDFPDFVIPDWPDFPQLPELPEFPEFPIPPTIEIPWTPGFPITPTIEIPLTPGETPEIPLTPPVGETDIPEITPDPGEPPAETPEGGSAILAPIRVDAALIAQTDTITSTATITPTEPITATTPITPTESITPTTGTTMGDVEDDETTIWFNRLYLTVDPDQAQAIKQNLFYVPGAASVLLVEDARVAWDDLSALLYLFAGVMVAFCLVMAFALIYNAMTVNLLERQREFATMRSIGTQQSRLVMQLLAENFILWLIALIPGILLGTWVSAKVWGAFELQGVNFLFALEPATYVGASLLILLTMVLSALPIFRRISRMNLAEVTKTLN